MELKVPDRKGNISPLLQNNQISDNSGQVKMEQHLN